MSHDGLSLEEHFRRFRDNIIGIDQTFESPFGTQRIVYADWIASGRLYEPIEHSAELGKDYTYGSGTNAFHHKDEVDAQSPASGEVVHRQCDASQLGSLSRAGVEGG